jgi:hypothetical protein
VLGGQGRGPLSTPVDYDALLINDGVSRQVSATQIRRVAGSLSRFVDAPLRVSPIALGSPKTIPSGGAPPLLRESVPAIVSPQVTVGR